MPRRSVPDLPDEVLHPKPVEPVVCAYIPDPDIDPYMNPLAQAHYPIEADFTKEDCICLTGHDLGVREYGGSIAYVHPECPLHGSISFKRETTREHAPWLPEEGDDDPF